MAKKKPETKVDEAIEKEIPEGYVEITPEQLMELQGGGIQTVMNIGLGEKLVLENMQDRIMYLDGEVNSDVLHTIIMQIYKLNGIDIGLEPEDMQPIILIINSGGGSVMDGLTLCDAINASRVPVIAICIGYAYSMAFNIFTQCDLRLATKNASFLYHDGWTCDSNVSSKVKDAAKFYDKVDERVNKLIANKTKLTADYLSSIARADTYWFADEGKENGFVDAIIGEDIDIAEIFGFMGDIPCECDHDKCDCKKWVTIDGEHVRSRANVMQLTSFSSHACRSELLDRYTTMPYNKIYLVHGEKSGKEEFAKLLRDSLSKVDRSAKVHIPVMGDNISF